MGNFSQITYDDFTRIVILQIVYENYYYEQLAKISTWVKYSIVAYHKYILPRYILLFYFGNVNSRDFIKLIPSMLCFPGFLTVSYRFPWCFRMFLPVFLRFPSVFLLSVSPVSYYRFCEYLSFCDIWHYWYWTEIGKRLAQSNCRYSTQFFWQS